MFLLFLCSILFFFNDTATTEIYTLSLHDALPISKCKSRCCDCWPIHLAFTHCSKKALHFRPTTAKFRSLAWRAFRSEEHTSELQSRLHLVCRLLLEKKKKIRT